jgi:hypothetical protein
MTMSLSRSLMLSSLLSAAAILSLTADAGAGAKGANNVYVSAAGRVAQGDLGQARNSADSQQAIGCYAQSYRNASGVFEQVTCQARDQSGASYSCYATEPELVRSARAINGDSWLYFRGDDAGRCINIMVWNDSTFQPKLP